MDLALGDRMKYYEQMAYGQLMPLIPICARMDGRAFHTFTRGLKRPYDENFSRLMVETTKYLVEETSALIGYTQSDEISLVWHTDDPKTQVFFDRRVFKMVSILGSMTSAYFNKRLLEFLPEKVGVMPIFDARVWNVPNKAEAINYLMWREDDATKNSISMAAQSLYSHKQLHEKNSSDKQELLWQKGVNWNDYPSFFKRGTYIQRKEIERPFTVEELDKLPEKHEVRRNPELKIKRRDTIVLDIPPIRRISNVEAVFFENADPLFS